MPQTTGFARLCAAGCLAAIAAAPARAAEEDTQLWTTFTLAGTLAEGLEALAEVSPRARSEAAGDEMVLGRVAADYRIAPAVTLGGGLTFVEFAGGSEWRPHQQLVVNAGRLSLRTRLEERFFAGADRMELRLRQRVQLGIPLGEGTSLAGAAEILALVQTRNSGQRAQIDQWRVQATLRRRLTPQVEASIGYMLSLSPRAGRTDRLSHIPQIGVTFRP